MFDNNTFRSLNTNILKFHAQAAGFIANVDILLRKMLIQAAIVQRIVCTECESDRLAADVFQLLRLKLALMMQILTPSVSFRSKAPSVEQLENFHNDMCTGGTSCTDVECSFHRF